MFFLKLVFELLFSHWKSRKRKKSFPFLTTCVNRYGYTANVLVVIFLSFTCVFKSGIDQRALFEAKAGAEAEGLKKKSIGQECCTNQSTQSNFEANKTKSEFSL